MHVYNAKKNAVRAAKKFGLAVDAVKPTTGGFYVEGAPEGKPAKAAKEPKAAKAPKAKAERKAKAAKPAKAAKVKLRRAEDLPREGTKNRKMLDLMCRPGGASMGELLKATGWKRCTGTMRVVARTYGFKVARHAGADGAVTRWEATR